MRTACLFLTIALCASLSAQAKTIAIDVPAGTEEIAESLRSDGWLQWLLGREEGPKIEIGPGARGDAEIYVRLLPVDESVSEHLAGLPVRFDSGALELDGTAYGDPGLTLAVRLPRAEKRTWLVTGARPDHILGLVRLVLLKEAGARIWGRDDQPFDYLLRETAWLERSGVWRATAEGFEVDHDGERDDFTARDAYYGGMRTVAGRAVELRATAEVAARPEVRELARRLDAAATRMARRIPLKLERPIEVVIERDHPTQGRYLGEIGEAVLTPAGSVHLILHPDDEHAYLHAIAGAVLARAGLAKDLSPWIREGAALWLSESWYGRDWRAWLPRMAAAGVLPSAEQLLAAERQDDGSAPLWAPVAASLVDSAMGETLSAKLGALPGEAAARAHLARLVTLELKAELRDPVRELPFLRGVSFAMLNRLEGGYHAPVVDERYARLGRLGANAVSVMPFAYQREPDDPKLHFLNDSPTSETDVGTLYAARRARAAGMKVLWKPHIWLSHDSWPGEIEMRSEADWAAWFESYRRFAAHHALLAEWSGSELFSIGVELGKTLEREREWRELIATVRLFFSGAVTYAGNWHGDYDRAPFWGELDFVGVDAYFPLASGEDVAPVMVTRGAEGVVERLRQAAERFGKPVLLTEVGYAARAGAWVEPHEEGGTFSAEHQARAYEALFDALGKPPWLAGVFTWKAFSAERGNPERPDFRFLDRPAEAVVRDYFAPRDEAATRHTSN
ncbi:MAG: hypothetical protein GY719_11630 [bacterium]|nr:hypothetical protein [bacterium]